MGKIEEATDGGATIRELTLLERGKLDVEGEIGKLVTQRLIEKIGIRGLTYLIAEVLDAHYPADIFGDGSKLYPSWASEHGGEDIDPGVKWAALLRTAIEVVKDR